MRLIVAILAALTMSLTACGGDQAPTTGGAGVDVSRPLEPAVP
jgi:hypothetical protein